MVRGVRRGQGWFGDRVFPVPVLQQCIEDERMAESCARCEFASVDSSPEAAPGSKRVEAFGISARQAKKVRFCAEPSGQMFSPFEVRGSMSVSICIPSVQASFRSCCFLS